MSGKERVGRTLQAAAYRLGRVTGRAVRLGRRAWGVRWLRRGMKLAVLLTVAAGLTVAGINAGIVWGTSGDRFSSIAELPPQTDFGEPYQAAIVLGARVWEGGEPSHILEDRLIAALQLYRKGLVPKILVSGDHGQHGYDEVNAMAAWLLAAGVAEEDVLLDHAGFNTYDTMRRAAEVFGVRRAVVVTQGFHLPRAVWLARQAGIEAVGLKADRRRYYHERWNEFRESLARVKCVGEVLGGRDPKYLGAAIPIEGDGRVTWDGSRPGAK